MIKIIALALGGIVIGGIIAVIAIKIFVPDWSIENKLVRLIENQDYTVIGFLPYWLLDKTDKDYTKYIDTLAYFGLTVDEDGSIEQFTNPGESEPGWFALTSGKADTILDSFETNKHNKSLVLFGGNQEKIDQLMENPEEHAEQLVDEISPILTEYNFSDLNLDIEKTGIASESAQTRFTQFAKTIYEQLQQKNPDVTISIDVSPTALIKPYLVDIEQIAPYVDSVIFMTYDYHYQGSSVTGAVSPVGGAGVTAEYDTETAIREALRILPPEKIILGVPLYGYEWETLGDYPRAAVIPQTGITASNRGVEEFLASCATCSAEYDETDQESHVIYKDIETGTYHQIFYPDEQAIQRKIDLVKQYKLQGLALWAIGYDGETILNPLEHL